MAKKSIKRRTVWTVAIGAPVLGFLVGELLPLLIFEDFSLTAAMRRPGSAFHQRSVR